MAEYLTPYSDALLILSFVMIIVMLQSIVATIFRNAVEKYQAGEALPANHASITFRMVRSFENSLENVVILAPVLAVAIATSISPAWVWCAEYPRAENSVLRHGFFRHACAGRQNCADFDLMTYGPLDFFVIRT